MRTSGSSAVSHKTGRVGVNPRRSHVPELARKRCKTACNVCNSRRIRCSGTLPCFTCTRDQRTCVYPVFEKKVWVPEGLYKDLRSTKDILHLCLRLAVHDPAERQKLLDSARHHWEAGSRASPGSDGFSEGSSPAASSSTAGRSPEQYQLEQPPYTHQRPALLGQLSAADTEGKLLRDQHGTGRWLGGTSGATFLDHLKKFMHTLKSTLGIDMTTGSQFMASRGQYQTSDSRGLYIPPTAGSNIFPTNVNNGAMASTHLAKVSAFLQGPTIPMQEEANEFSCGGIHYFGEFSYAEWLTLSKDPRRPELAFYEAAFALGTIYSLTATNSRGDGQLGEKYVANARRILGDPMDVSRYNMRDVATLAILGMYMSENNRRDTAYVYYSHAITICSMFGGLKGSSRELPEADKRIIWTVFCLTRDLSCLMGRPPLFPLGAFQLPLPEAVPGLPSPDGLLAHIQLSKIADHIVSNTYAIAPQDGLQGRSDQVGPPLRMLKEWRNNLPDHMRFPYTTPAEESYEVQGFPLDRSLFMLHMKWNQLLILALRPLFFLAVKSAIGADFVSNTWRDVFGDKADKTREEYILECSAAARRTLCLGRYVNEMCNARSHDGAFHTTGKLVMLDLHHIFNATTILLLYQMVSLNVVNTDNYGIATARRIFETEASAERGGGTATGYASDCLGVLNDLAALVALIRPLRFKTSNHVHTCIENWVVLPVRQLTPASTLGSEVTLGAGGSSNSINGEGGCSTSMLGSPLALPSTEQLEANLGMANPYGPPDGMYTQFMQDQQQQMAMGLPSYTHRQEMERWLEEDTGHYYCSGAPPGGWTGL